MTGGIHSPEFTKTERRIVEYLQARAGAWVTAGEIIRDALGTHHRPDSPVVRVHIHFIRRKLGARRGVLESDPHRLRGYRWMGTEACNESLIACSR